MGRVRGHRLSGPSGAQQGNFPMGGNILSIITVRGGVLTSSRVITFSGRIVEIRRVDAYEQTITIRIREDQTWILRVVDPNIFTNDTLTKGDQVIIKVDQSDVITEIVKIGDQARSEPSRSTH